MDLIDSLIAEGWLKTPRIIEAFRNIKRADFLPDDLKDLAELNEALAIGLGQTISQPLVVAFMLELLKPNPGEKILDIGSGSGWTTALLAEIVKDKGKVIGIEIIPELAEFGRKNVAKYNFIEKGIAQILCADGSKGYEKESPYDRVLASAALDAASATSNVASASLQAESPEPSRRNELPKAWKEQLEIGGRIVAPIGNSIWLFIKKSKDEFEQIEYPGFVFVPLIT